MTKHEALTLALEILKAAYVPADLDEQREKAITELEALAQPERTGWPAGLLQDDDRKLSKWLASKPDAKHVVDMAQPEQCEYCKRGLKAGLCTCTPPQSERPWVVLTGQEKALVASVSLDVHDAVHRTDAKLKEKNT